MICTDPQAPAYWGLACQHLADLDPTWGDLVRRHPDRALRSRGEPFQTLLRSVIGQQISTKAADAVWARFLGYCEPGLTPQVVLGLSPSVLQQVGLSRQKLAYIQALAEFACEGQLDPDLLDALDDQQCQVHLCQVKGIGPWTAQMFLMFGLRRPDVWPVDDLGIQKAISLHFRQGEPTGPKEALKFGEKLKPWRTVAAWYLWRSLDPTVVDY